MTHTKFINFCFSSIACALSLLFFFGSSEILRAQDAYAEGAEAMKEGEYRRAEQIFRQGLRRAPGDYTLMQLLAHSVMNQRRYREADSLLREVVKADSNQVGSYWYLGLSLEKQRKDSAALFQYKTYIRKTEKQNNPNAGVWLRAGSCYRRMLHDKGLNGNELDDMISSYNRYLQLNPTDPMGLQLAQFMEQVQQRRPANYAVRWVWNEQE
jgi:tetratricopeptide (TPR) repeat protein